MLWLFAMFACQTPQPLSEPDVAGPPPQAVSVTSTTLVEGWPATLDVELVGVGAGVRVHLAGSWGTVFQSTCPPWFHGGCIDLVDPFLIGVGVTDAQGHARISWTPGYSITGALRVQALVLRQAFASGTIALPFDNQGEDSDHDGLDAETEMLLGTNLTLPDSDGGGIEDGQEVLVDLTDPRLTADDLSGERTCDGDDADGDGLRDCDDPDCVSIVACFEVECRNRQDDDGDGLTDCDDPHCDLQPHCGERSCNDRIDNDGDRKRDCADPDCWTPDCHDEVVAWVDSGSATWHLAGVTPSLNHQLTGRVWVSGPLVPARICSWYSIVSDVGTGEMEAIVDPACLLTKGFLPSVATLVLDPTAGLRAPNGALLIGPLQDYQPGDTRAEIPAVTASEPLDTCAGGLAPRLMLEDHDGDGFGVNDWVDLFGTPGGRVWSCDPNHPGLTLVGGDCHDGDATHNPSTVRLAVGATCATLRFDDQDGDGAKRCVDADDRDGLVQ